MPGFQHYHDDMLLTLLKAGDERAVTMLFDWYYDWLIASIEPYVNDETDADDIVHELIWSIWKKRDTLNITRPVYRYLLKSAFNRVRNRVRNLGRAQVRLNVIVKDSNDLASLPASIPGFSADSHLHVADILRLETIAKGRMSGRVRLTYVLSRGHGLTYPKIAERMGITVKGVEKNMSTALKILYDVFGSYLKILLLLFGYET